MTKTVLLNRLIYLINYRFGKKREDNFAVHESSIFSKEHNPPSWVKAKFNDRFWRVGEFNEAFLRIVHIKDSHHSFNEGKFEIMLFDRWLDQRMGEGIYASF